MAMLDGFRTFNFNEGLPYVSITSNGVTFNKSVIVKLGYPEYVRLLIDDDSRRIAVQVCDEKTTNATTFFKERKSKIISVRWGARDLLNTLSTLMGWNLEKESYRIDGELLREERAMLFDLNKAVLLN